MSSIKGADHDDAHKQAELALRLCFWPEIVDQFWKDNESAIRGLAMAMPPVPNFAKMSRKDALKAIASFPGAARGVPPTRQRLKGCLLIREIREVGRLGINFNP